MLKRVGALQVVVAWCQCVVQQTGTRRKRRAGAPHVGSASMNSPSYLPTAANSRVGRRGMAIGSVYLYLGSAD